MKRSSMLTLLLWIMLIALGMAIGYGIAASYYSAPPFKPDMQESRTTGQMMEAADETS